MKAIAEFLSSVLLASLALAPSVCSQEDSPDEGGSLEQGTKSAFEHPCELDADRRPALDASDGLLLRGVTLHSALEPAREADVLIQHGRIGAIGSDLRAPEGVLVLDGAGKHLAPGVIDTHSHMAIEGGVNEGTLSITADCDISDAIDPDDLSLWRALAGGVTTIQCLHGSANTIGGRSEILKLRWKRSADELRFPDAPQGIKFALGENPKQSNYGSGNRFPASRPGVESVLTRAFERTREYDREWRAFEGGRARGEDPAPPRRDLRLEVLSGILAGTVGIHSHCYRADEILMLLRSAESFGIRVRTLQHVLEGYKVADEIARHGAGTSTFSDWWAYKQEAYDAIPQNAALLDEAGVVSTVNSDSDELVRHLQHEAAKSVRYAGLDPVRALALCTRNGAIQLGIEARVGTIEVGKDADVALYDGDPLSIASRVLWTMVDGRVEFERRDAFGLDGAELPVRDLEEAGVDPVQIVEAGSNGHGSARPANGPVLAIVGATLHPVTSPDIEDGVLLVQDGRILALGVGLSVPASARVVDAAGGHVWPGMIALDTALGLREIGSVKGTIDDREIGGNQPDLRTASSIHADSAHVPVTRSSGITRAQTSPQGRGPLSGRSAVIRCTGDTWEEMLTLDRDMLHLRFPEVPDRLPEGETRKEPESLDELRRLLRDAREYARLSEEAERDGLVPPSFDPRLEALVPYARGEERVALHASGAQTILYGLKFAQEEGLDVVLFGVKEGWKVVDAIARAGVPVAVGPVLALPSSEFDPYDACYANPAVLHRAGVRVALLVDGENVRNLPFQAGFAAAYGLPYAEALRAITYYPAEILGLERELGSLAAGKIADIVVTDGDLLEATTRVTHVLIDGEPQDLGNRQTELYERYRARLHEAQGR
jgi:imidazolonepropionase-like amidohydrolase